jgi:hypothetical protein
MILRRIDPVSAAKVAGILYALLGVLFGVFMALFGSFFDAAGGGGFGGSFGVAAIFILPVMYGIIGLIGGLISAFLYNLVAGWVGGVEVEFEEEYLDDRPPAGSF